MKKIILIVLFICTMLMLVSCKGNDNNYYNNVAFNEVYPVLKFDVSALTDDDFSSVGTSELKNAKKEDFKKIRFTLNVTNRSDITKRTIIFPTGEEIKAHANSNKIDRYWFGSEIRDNSRVKSAMYRYDFVFYSKGLNDQDIRNMFGSLTTKVSWYSPSGSHTEITIPVSDGIQFH